MSNKVKITKSSFCIVASTLPIGFIAAQIEELRIKRIYVLTKTHELAYLNLKKLNPSLEIMRLPSVLLLREACYLFMLIRARLASSNVIFFHECCLSIFDLLLCMIKPRGYYFPQVTMSGFHEIEPSAFPKTKDFRLFKLLGLIDRFRYYRSPQIGSNDIEYVASIRNYPRSITVMSVDYSRQVLSRCSAPGDTKTKSILFVIGKSYVADAHQEELFSLLAALAFAKGYVCHIKDHPNSSFRLNLQIDGAEVKDPLLPVDLMDKDYHLAVGVSSTALLLFNERAISLINLLDGMSQENRLLCVKHYDSALPNNRINYIRSLEEFEKML